jgi:cyclopropane fatty-acyl-phospholipid synthase-like methyltransferase
VPQDPAQQFDPVKYKETTREQWQAAAEPWDRWGPTVEGWLGGATEAMLEMAGVGPGSHVLDVAAGAGGQTIAAAKRVGRTSSSSPPEPPEKKALPTSRRV